MRYYVIILVFIGIASQLNHAILIVSQQSGSDGQYLLDNA